MITLGGVVIDCSSQVFKIAASSAVAPSYPNIFTTGLAGDLGKHLAAPVVIEALDALGELRLVSLPFPGVVVVDREHVGDVDLLDIPLPPRGRVLGG
jgi:hypothetical protein